MIVIPCDGNDDFLDVSSRLWLAQDGEPSLLVIDTFGRLDGNPELKSKLRDNPRVELASLNLKHPTCSGHVSDPVAYAHDYAFARCHTKYLLATHVDVFPLHRGVVTYMESQMNYGGVAGWGMSPRGPEAKHAWENGLPYPEMNPFSDAVMGMVCTIYDIPTLDRSGASWSIRRGHHEFALPRVQSEWGWPDTETTFAKIMAHQGVTMRFLGRETNFENQETEHWLHARSVRIGMQERHVAALNRAAALAASWGCRNANGRAVTDSCADGGI
ncbi:MAG: hypothetical protein JWP89_3607 [Schlesneria sp.]|nr:hypothetical protein [Schlesneria sp.]